MSRELEFEELLYYVVELKDKLNTKLDAQTVKINHQGSIINQQGQIVDELCWQLRELSEKVRDLRAENHRLRERVDQLCPNCAGCHCGVTTYENHIVDKYNELLGVVDSGSKKTTPPSISPPALVSSSDDSDQSVKTTVEGHDQQQQQQQQQQETRQTYPKIDEYTQVVKKRDASGSTKKKWLGFGGTSDKKEPAATTSVMSTDSKTIWYIDDESIYEPIELSAKPTTRAQLEKISAEVSSTPQPAPRRLYSAQAVDNLTQYFQDGSSLCEIEEFDEEDEDGDEDRGSGVMLRPSLVKQFGPDSQRGSSMVAYSRIADLDLSHLPEEECISRENIVRFTVSSRPATVVPTTGAEKEASDNRRHAIRSYM